MGRAPFTASTAGQVPVSADAADEVTERRPARFAARVTGPATRRRHAANAEDGPRGPDYFQ